MDCTELHAAEFEWGHRSGPQGAALFPHPCDSHWRPWQRWGFVVGALPQPGVMLAVLGGNVTGFQRPFCLLGMALLAVSVRSCLHQCHKHLTDHQRKLCLLVPYTFSKRHLGSWLSWVLRPSYRLVPFTAGEAVGPSSSPAAELAEALPTDWLLWGQELLMPLSALGHIGSWSLAL